MMATAKDHSPEQIAEVNRLFAEIDERFELKESLTNGEFAAALGGDPAPGAPMSPQERALWSRLTREIIDRLERLEALGVDLSIPWVEV
jgi:hypothetical protein